MLIPVIAFAGICVGRLNRAVGDYPYSTELPKPGIGVDFKYDDRIADIYVRWSNLVDNVLTAVWKAPTGVARRALRVRARDGCTIGGYILEPEGCGAEKLPTMLYCHGGAFFLTMMNCQLDMAAAYAGDLHCRVVMPQYRTSLDHPYPTPFYDCCDVLRALAEWDETDADRVMIYGDSAGGCLAAEVTHWCCDEGLLMPAAQMLIYPVTENEWQSASMLEYENAVWTKDANAHMWKKYLNGCVPTSDEYAVPMLHERFPAYPKTYVEVAEMDTLRDQGLAYAGRMESFDIEVETEVVPGAYHGYDSDVNNALVRRRIEQREMWLRDAIR